MGCPRLPSYPPPSPWDVVINAQYEELIELCVATTGSPVTRGRSVAKYPLLHGPWNASGRSHHCSSPSPPLLWRYRISVTPPPLPPTAIGCRCFAARNRGSGSPVSVSHSWSSLPPPPFGTFYYLLASITYLSTCTMVCIALPVLHLRDPCPPAVCCTSAGASPHVTRSAGALMVPCTGGPPPPPAPSPAPARAALPPPFLGSASGPSHGCPPTLHPPPGAQVGDPTVALHLPPSPAAPVGDPTAAIHPPPLPKQRLWAIRRLHSFPIPPPAAPVGDPTAALPPPLPTTRPIIPPAEWPSGQPHELLSGSRGFESLPSPRAPNTGNTF